MASLRWQRLRPIWISHARALYRQTAAHCCCIVRLLLPTAAADATTTRFRPTSATPSLLGAHLHTCIVNETGPRRAVSALHKLTPQLAYWHAACVAALAVLLPASLNGFFRERLREARPSLRT